MYTNTAIKNMINIILKGIQIGDKTQNQDQVITFVSFKTINAIVNNPGNPIPVDVLFFFMIK